MPPDISLTYGTSIRLSMMGKGAFLHLITYTHRL